MNRTAGVVSHTPRRTMSQERGLRAKWEEPQGAYLGDWRKTRSSRSIEQTEDYDAPSQAGMPSSTLDDRCKLQQLRPIAVHGPQWNPDLPALRTGLFAGNRRARTGMDHQDSGIVTESGRQLAAETSRDLEVPGKQRGHPPSRPPHWSRVFPWTAHDIRTGTSCDPHGSVATHWEVTFFGDPHPHGGDPP